MRQTNSLGAATFSLSTHLWQRQEVAGMQNTVPLLQGSPLYYQWLSAAGIKEAPLLSEPRPQGSSHFALYGAFCLSWLHTGASMLSTHSLSYGASWKLWQAKTRNRCPKPNQGAAEVVICCIHGHSHGVSKRNINIWGKFTHISKLSDRCLSQAKEYLLLEVSLL